MCRIPPLVRHPLRGLALAFALVVLPALSAASIVDPAAVRGSAAPGTAPAHTGELLVAFRPGAAPATRDSILADLGIARVDSLPRIAAARMRPARLSVEEAIRRYRGHPAVAYIEPNVIVRSLAMPNDPRFREMWSLRNTGQTDGLPGFDTDVAPAWDITTGSDSVLVAITDTGMDWRHVDLAPNVWTNAGEIAGNGRDDDGNGYVDDVHGWDFANGDRDPMDDVGHGTHVAGTIGAVGNNWKGVTGINWHVRMMPVKFLNRDGEGPLSDGIASIDYAVRMGARIINASWGSNFESQALREAIVRAGEAGVLVVAAAGNSGVNNDGGDPYGPPSYPAAYDLPNIIAVGAYEYRGGIPWWSNYGIQSVDLAAPGLNILSTLPHGNYGLNHGTSMAAPHVTGVAALVLAAHPHADALDVKELILNGVVAVPAWKGLFVTGGRLDAFGALSNRDSIPPAPVSDLAVTDVNGTRVTLRWSGSGDDGPAGSARRYELRMSTSPMDAGNFVTAARVAGVPASGPAGTAEEFTVRGLAYGTTYDFALVPRDECGNGPGPSNVVRVTTLPRPEIDVSPQSFSLSLLSGQHESRTLTIANAGPSELPVTIRGAQPWLAIEPGEALVPAGGRLDVAIRADATGRLGGYSAAIDIRSPDADEPRIVVPVTLRVTGASDVVMGSDSLAFSETIAGQTGELDLEIHNRGSESLHLTSIAASPSAFTVPSTEFMVLPGASSLLRVRFTPPDTVVYSGTLTMTSDDPDRPSLGVALAGRGVPAPRAILEPLAFADTLPSYATVTHTLTFRNAKDGDLRFTIEPLTAGWMTVAPLSGHVAPGDSARVSVTVRAADLQGDRYSTLIVHTNDPALAEVLVPVRLQVRPAGDIVLSQAPRSAEWSEDYFWDSATTLHDLEVTGPTVGDARAELIVKGGYGNEWPGGAALDVEGLWVGSVSQAWVPRCTTVGGEFVVPEAEFERMAADGVVHARVTCNTHINSSCEVNQHRVRLTWSPALEVLDFGEVPVGTSAVTKLTIRNRGLEPLQVERPTPAAPFSVEETTGFVLAPGDTGTFTIGCRPTAAGLLQAGLIVRSNDPDRAAVEVPVRAQGVLPAVAALSIPRLDRSLATGQRVTVPLVVTNTGGSDLAFEIAVQGDRPAPGDRPALQPLARAASPAAASAPAAMADAWVLLVQDSQPWDFMNSAVNEYLLNLNGIRFNSITTPNLATVDLSSCTKIIVAGDQPTTAYQRLQAVMPRLADFVYRGGTLEVHTGFGWAGGDASLLTLPRGVGFRFAIASSNYVLDPTHPLMAGLPSPFDVLNRQSEPSIAALTNVPDDAQKLAMDDGDRVNLVVYRWGAGSVIASGHALEFGAQRGWSTGVLLANMIPFQAGPRRPWLTADTLRGRVPPGGSATIELRLDAAGLGGGDYAGSVVLQSPDLVGGPVTLPVRLNVTAAPDLAVQGPEVTLETFQLFHGSGGRTTHAMDLPVTPAGGGTIDLTAMGDLGEPDEFATLRLEGAVLGENGRAGNDLCPTTLISVPVSPATLGRAAADGRLDLEVRNSVFVGTTMCTMNEHRVRLTYRAPASPLTFGRVWLGQCAERRIEVSNHGPVDLHLAAPAPDDAAFRVEPGAGVTLAPGESRTLAVSFCPAATGAVEARLTLRSDDPDSPEVVLQLAAEGVPPPDVALAPGAMQVALLPGESATRALWMANEGGTPLAWRLQIESDDDTTAPAMRVPAPTPVSALQWAGIQERYRAFRSAHGAPARAAMPARPVTPWAGTLPVSAVTPPARAPSAAPSEEAASRMPSGAPAEGAVATPAPSASTSEAAATAAPTNETVIFFDDMEHGENGWTHAPTSNSFNDHWMLSAVRASSGRRSWQVTAHEWEGSDALESPRIDLTGHRQARLSFATWYAFDDCYASPGYEPDGGVVEVSEEGSGTWVPVAPVNGYPWVLDATCENPLGDRPAFAHRTAGDAFVTEVFDLSAFAGKAIRIRFQSGWDCGNCDVPPGWFIDDVKVYSDAPAWASALPANGEIAAGDVAEAAVAFTTAGVAPGRYHAALRAVTNDPDEPIVRVPLELLLAGFAATVDITPNTVNLAHRGRWLMVSIELPNGLDPAAIVPASLRLNGVAHADPGFAALGDRDGDGIGDLTVRFALDDVRPTLATGGASVAASRNGSGDVVPMLLTGALRDGGPFLGRTTLRVLRPRLALAGAGVLQPGSACRVSWSAADDWGATTVTLAFSRNGGVTWLPVAAGLAGTRYDWTVPGAATQRALLRAEFRDAEGLLATDVLERPFAIGAPESGAAGVAGPARFALRSVPNPFADGTEIVLTLPRAAPVELAVFSVTGRRLRTLVRGPREAGELRLRWDGRDARGARLAAGIYFLRVVTPEGAATWRTTLLR